ncbi:MAG TPA: hypothetical protein VH877_27660 [Polyangia bacterium]|jgi:hypothetical protein|nr:hypothetical protein [Polyangia bacterium]
MPPAWIFKPGEREAEVTFQFFAALTAGDASALAELLDEAAWLENIDGPVPTAGRHELAALLAGHSREVEYRLEEVYAGVGRSRARFSLLVAEVPGGILLEACLSFRDRHITAIVVRQPEPEPLLCAGQRPEA